MSTIQASNLPILFDYQGQEIRAFEIDGEPWWVAKDVCEVLGIDNVSLAVKGNPTRGDDGLDDDETRIYQVNTNAGPRGMLCVSEPGLYALIHKSNRPEAKAFRRWIRHEVLPAIRRTGRFESADAPAIDNPLVAAIQGLAVEIREGFRALMPMARPRKSLPSPKKSDAATALLISMFRKKRVWQGADYWAEIDKAGVTKHGLKEARAKLGGILGHRNHANKHGEITYRFDVSSTWPWLTRVPKELEGKALPAIA